MLVISFFCFMPSYHSTQIYLKDPCKCDISKAFYYFWNKFIFMQLTSATCLGDCATEMFQLFLFSA